MRPRDGGYEEEEVVHLTKKDLEKIKVIGKDTYGVIYLVISNGKEVVLKVANS